MMAAKLVLTIGAFMWTLGVSELKSCFPMLLFNSERQNINFSVYRLIQSFSSAYPVMDYRGLEHIPA